MVFTNADSLNTTTGEHIKFAIPVRPHLCDTPDPYLQQMTGAMHIWPLTVCVRKTLSLQILKECPEVTDSTYAMGDTQRFLEISRRAKVKYLAISTATRNLLPESATNSRSIKKKAGFINSSQRLTLHYLKKYPLPEKEDRAIRTWVAKRAVFYAYLCRDKAKAEKEMDVLKSLDKGIPWKYRLYAFGSRSQLRHRIVVMIFKILLQLSTIRKDLMQGATFMNKSLGKNKPRIN